MSTYREFPIAWCATCDGARSTNALGCMACQARTVRPMAPGEVRDLVERVQRSTAEARDRVLRAFAKRNSRRLP